ncbi:hypothetical protein PVK06_020625 [Gossypium arboreum]|uniref:Uncharacterized protein n=1 Tax=Gossypium arboreum TaxID=29729 RepID=A0ABR0PNC7_GOSAR|nr:hypothetical protein PVK06_020625 [Gossypium arboreum]
MGANRGCAQCREKASKVTSKMTGRNFDGLRMGQVSKVVEVKGLEIYCSICKDAANDLSLSNTGGSESWFNSHSVGDKSEHIVEPFNVSLSLLVLTSSGVCGKSAAKGLDLYRRLWESAAKGLDL